MRYVASSCDRGDCAHFRPGLLIENPGAVIDDVSFVDCVFRGVRTSEVVEASGSILFHNVKNDLAEKGRSLNSRLTWPEVLRIISPLIENRKIASLTPILFRLGTLFQT